MKYRNDDDKYVLIRCSNTEGSSVLKKYNYRNVDMLINDRMHWKDPFVFLYVNKETAVAAMDYWRNYYDAEKDKILEEQII